MFNKKINVNCYCRNQQVTKLFPIIKASRVLPKWLKELKSEKEKCSKTNIKSSSVNKKTIRSCSGVRELFNNSYMQRLWSDLEIYIDVNQKYMSWYFADGETEIVIHETSQRGDFLSAENYTVLKVISPWFIETKKSINWSIVPPVYHDQKQIDSVHTLPGLLNFKYQHSPHIFIAVKNMTGSYFIKAGTPLAYMIPQTEKSIKLNNIYDENKCKQLDDMQRPFAFEKSYFKKRLQLNKDGV